MSLSTQSLLPQALANDFIVSRRLVSTWLETEMSNLCSIFTLKCHVKHWNVLTTESNLDRFYQIGYGFEIAPLVIEWPARRWAVMSCLLKGLLFMVALYQWCRDISSCVSGTLDYYSQCSVCHLMIRCWHINCHDNPYIVFSFSSLKPERNNPERLVVFGP